VLKEKLKLLKGCLKEWHEQHERSLLGRLKEVKERKLASFRGERGSRRFDRFREGGTSLSFFPGFSLSIMQCINQLQQCRLI
jgi:hypothetical protein